jgi:hypothetical protein
MGTSDDMGELETAYISVKDYSGTGEGSLSTATTKSVLSKASGGGSVGTVSEDKVIKVQFNPDSLTFSYGGAVKKNEKTSIGSGTEKAPPQAKPEDTAESINISMKLIYDRSIYVDSSVQPEVEQLLAILKKHYVRKITFYWGTMCYSGILKSIDAEYVLFNSTGVPMRAVVNLTMQVT